MPAEAPDSTFKDRVTAVSYPVQEAGGLVFAYLGPSPAPVLPLWGPLAWENVARDIAITRAAVQLAAVPGELVGPGTH